MGLLPQFRIGYKTPVRDDDDDDDKGKRQHQNDRSAPPLTNGGRRPPHPIRVHTTNTNKGETFHQAAERGLKEELGIAAALPKRPAIARHLRRVTADLPDGSTLVDCEFVESYRLDGFEGEVGGGG